MKTRFVPETKEHISEALKHIVAEQLSIGKYSDKTISTHAIKTILSIATFDKNLEAKRKGGCTCPSRKDAKEIYEIINLTHDFTGDLGSSTTSFFSGVSRGKMNRSIGRTSEIHAKCFLFHQDGAEGSAPKLCAERLRQDAILGSTDNSHVR
ncbi:MAG: hypothetical protein ACTSXX_02785 [Candidatus Baldrarchaeia archaeon]